MKIIAKLGRLEASFFRPWMIGNQRSQYLQIAGIVLIMLAGSLFLFHDTNNLERYFLTGIGFSWFALSYLSMLRVAFIANGSLQEWWLTLPYPRFSLVIGKAAGVLCAGIHFIVYTLLVMTAHCLIATSQGWMQPFDMQAFFRAASLFLLYSCIGLPCTVAIGMLSLLFQVGWARIGLGVLFTIVPIMLVGWMFAAETNAPVASMVPMVSAIVLIGWPLALLLLWVAATLGLKRLGNARYSYEGAGSSLKQPHQSVQQAQSTAKQSLIRTQLQNGIQAKAKRTTPFWTLVRLEQTRYRWIGRKASRKAKFIAYPLMMILLIISYCSGSDFEDVLFLQNILLTLSYPVIVVYALAGLHYDLQKGQGEWWLTFPHSRLLLLGSRLFAFFTSMLSYLGLAFLLAAIGVTIRSLSQPILGEHWIFIGSNFLYAAAPTLLAVFINVSLFQIAPLAYKYKEFLVFFVPVYSIHVFVTRYLTEWFFPNQHHYETGVLIPPDYWTHLFYLIGIGFPLAAICILLGAKHLNEYLNAGRMTGAFRKWK